MRKLFRIVAGIAVILLAASLLLADWAIGSLSNTVNYMKTESARGARWRKKPVIEPEPESEVEEEEEVQPQTQKQNEEVKGTA